MVLTAKERRAAHYNEELEERVDRVVILDAQHTQKRYAPWLEKALERANHSKHTWAKFKSDQEAKKQQEKSNEQDQKR